MRCSFDGASERSINTTWVAMSARALWPTMLVAFMPARAAALFGNFRDRIAMQAGGSYAAVSIESAKDCILRDVGCLQSLFDHPGRAGMRLRTFCILAILEDC
jgi:hypothetical protein